MSTPLLNHRYRVLQSLAEGGFGKTFLAEDTQMPSKRHCVIKQLKPMSDKPGVFAIIQQRFDREAAVLESVGRGNSQIPDLYAYFAEDNQFYLVQEWVEGKPLSAVTPDDWTEETMSKLLADALSALAHVHSRKIIHRDIKPDNIILRKRDQLPCLIDFGAVKEVMSTVVTGSGTTQSSMVIGTPGFMPPEQAAGRPTFASDIYSLAMTAIYLLTGRSPTEFPVDSSNGRVLWQQFAPTLSTRFTSILTRAIHPYPQTRYATANDMLAALNPPEQEAATEATIAPKSWNPSTAPTVAVSPGGPQTGQIRPTAEQTSGQTSGQTSANTVASFKQPAGDPLKKSPYYSLSTSAEGTFRFPWKQVGIGVGALAIAAGILVGIRPRLSFQNDSSEASGVDIEQLEKAAEENPDDSTAQVNLAEAYLETGKYDKATNLLAPIIKAEANSAAALTTKGEVAFVQGDYDTALVSFNQALEKDTSSAETYNRRGDTYYETGEYDKALEDYRSALRVDSKNGLAYLNWSAVNVVKGNTEESLQNLNNAVETDPSLISSWVNRGNRKAELNDKLGAAQDWQKAISMTAITANDFASRGYAKSRMGDKSGALDDYNQALIINPQFPRTYLNRAAIFYEQGNKSQALAELEKALTINPNYVSALLFKGEIKSFQTNPDPQAALAAYSKAIEVNPNDPGVLNNRCGAYFATKQIDLALTDCDRGLRVNPKGASLYNGRGNIRLFQENYDGAIQDYSRAIDLYNAEGRLPAAQSAYSNRAGALFQIQDFKGALADINKALELNPNAPEDYYKRGLIKVAQNNTDAASVDMRKAADLYIEQGRTDSHRSVIAMMKQLGLE